jgi:hypothetical protein
MPPIRSHWRSRYEADLMSIVTRLVSSTNAFGVAVGSSFVATLRLPRSTNRRVLFISNTASVCTVADRKNLAA